MDDSDFESPKKKDKPPSSSASTSAVPKIRADRFRLPTADPNIRGAHVRCPICNKDLNHLSDVRRAIHVNSCVDSDKNEAAVAEAKNMAKTMFACPCCGDMVAKGPYLIAHATKCAKLFGLDVNNLIKTLETHSVIDVKLRNTGLSKAAPLTSELIQKAKKRLVEAETTVSTPEPAQPPAKMARTNRGRGVLASKMKSTVFAPKEPVTCRCNGLHAIQKRFCAQFKCRDRGGSGDRAEAGLEESRVCKSLKKLDRYARLADDLRRSLFKQTDMRLKAKDGGSVPVHSFIISVRTKITIPKDAKEVPIDCTVGILEAYVHYLYTTEIMWTLDDHEEIGNLARAYGPLDLAMLIDNEDDNFDNPFAADDHFDPIPTDRTEPDNLNPIEEPFPMTPKKFDGSPTFMDVDLAPLKSPAPAFVAPPPVSMVKTVFSDDDDEIAVIECIPAPIKKNQEDRVIPAAKDFSFSKTLSQPNVQSAYKTPEKSTTPLARRSNSITSLNASADLFDSPPLTSMQRSIRDSPPPKTAAFKSDASKSSSVLGTTTLTKPPASSLPQRSAAIPEDDSFFDDKTIFLPSTPKDRILPSSPDNRQNEMTETGRARYIAMKLGSGVKVVKTTDITPMPAFEKFTDAELKDALGRYNIRPMGRKRAIEMLKRIYDDHHPVIDNLQTPKRRPRSPLTFDLDAAFNGSDDSGTSGNECDSENPEASVYFDNDEAVGSSQTTGSPTKGKLIKDVDTGVKQFAEWLRLPENEELYANVLAMRPINLNDITTLMAASSHGVKRITKKILADVLDRLHVTFSIPEQKWGKGRGYKNG
uniref:UBZ4-type domain-containing protein n=1 Tax=Panagrellus redivivus TaxID=6233 RepID=A0A7E4ZUF5_PANRE